MAALHNAFKALAPITFSDLPTAEADLDTWISDLFSQSQLILDSIPIAEASETSVDPKSSASSVASNASEITLSSARPHPPAPEHQALQKEWGKPVKLGAKENALGMSVYKVSGKDGRGAWFARRSVHEGISFPRFKKALEMEFPESLAVQGAPGEGNVRGIGGETRVEDIRVPSRGKVEVYRLSAQFPGPTAPRDFVTMLVTSENAITAPIAGEPVPRHYMIISKPCDHPETQPQSGFVRGFYESVEFIREVPRQAKLNRSATDPAQHTPHDEAVSKDAIIRNAQNKTNTHAVNEDSSVTQSADGVSRKRGLTAPSQSPALEEAHPVEWIMITRSDPGGSVPRFMVERGTPGSICADAEKFLNWACKQDFGDEQTNAQADPATPTGPVKRDSFQTFRSSRTVGIEGESNAPQRLPAGSHADVEAATTTTTAPAADDTSGDIQQQQQQQGGLLSAVSGAASYLGLYTPQAASTSLPENDAANPDRTTERATMPEPEDDAVSVASFESADSHIATSESEKASIASSKATVPRKSEEHLTSHDKELRKLDERRAALQTKFSESRTKLEQDASTHSAKDEAARQKIIEKHEKEVQKQKEKYEKELKKIEQKQEKEKKKLEDKKRKEADKDEKGKLTRERDEARKEAELLRKEADVLRNMIEELQKENTGLVAKLKVAESVSKDGRPPSSHSSHKKGHAASGSNSTSIRSQ